MFLLVELGFNVKLEDQTFQILSFLTNSFIELGFFLTNELGFNVELESHNMATNFTIHGVRLFLTNELGFHLELESPNMAKNFSNT